MREAQLSGHNLECGAGHCFLDSGGLSPLLMKPLRAEEEEEEELPTAANLNLCDGMAMMSRCLESEGRRSSLCW